MNRQREIIYDMRNNALNGIHEYKSWKEEISKNLIDFFENLKLNSDPKKFSNDINQLLLIEENNFENEDSINKLIKERLEFFENKFGEEKLSSSISGLLMRSIDLLWVEHLTTMDNMRQGIGLQAAGQRDPLIQYKKTGFELFENLLNRINRDVSINLLPFTSSININMNRVSAKPKINIDLNSKSKIGRNDPCPCGSGKKYKKCVGSSECDL